MADGGLIGTHPGGGTAESSAASRERKLPVIIWNGVATIENAVEKDDKLRPLEGLFLLGGGSLGPIPDTFETGRGGETAGSISPRGGG